MNEHLYFCYDDCKYLSITETEQDKRAKKDIKNGIEPRHRPHICKLLNKQVTHHGFKHHPKLVRWEECSYVR